MHKFKEIYYFINKFNKQEIEKLNKNISIIYRNYEKDYDVGIINELKKLCNYQKRKLYLANNLRLATRLNLDGLYIPSFNKLLNFNNISTKRNFKLIGSAHNTAELEIKKKQGCTKIFVSPIFKTNKSSNFLDIIKFNLITKESRNSIIALGGINEQNVSKLKLTKSYGFASISWIKKNGPSKLGPF